MRMNSFLPECSLLIASCSYFMKEIFINCLRILMVVLFFFFYSFLSLHSPISSKLLFFCLMISVIVFVARSFHQKSGDFWPSVHI